MWTNHKCSRFHTEEDAIGKVSLLVVPSRLEALAFGLCVDYQRRPEDP